VHKSALLRYFETHEEIYLHLTAEGWQDWVDGMRGDLAQLPVGSVTGVAQLIARTLADRPLLCDLMTHAPLTLERNVSVEAVRSFKLAALAALADITEQIRRVLPPLTDADVMDLVGAVTAIAAGLWQTTHPPAALVALYAEDPRLGHAQVEFTPSLQRLSEVVLTGLLARASAGAAPGQESSRHDG